MKKNHKPTGRLFWEKYVELACDKKGKDTLAINIGADDPTLLELPDALKFAKEIAKGKKFHTLFEIEDDIRVYGQNHLAERTFFFTK